MARQSQRQQELYSVSSEEEGIGNSLRTDIFPEGISHLVSEETGETPTSMLWVKDEPFIFGILSLYPCSKISVSTLRKVAEYCRDREGYYPRMNMGEWGHISKYKLQVPIDLSWAYFRLFDIISKPVDISSSSKNAWDMKCEALRMGTISDNDVDVDTLTFLAFLYIQNYQRLHKTFVTPTRTTRTSDDPWPVPSISSSCGSIPGSVSSTSMGSPKSTTVSRKQIPEKIHFEFVVANLDELVNLLVLAVPKREGQDARRMSLEVVSALSLILGAASYPLDREFKSLEEMILIIPELREFLEFDLKLNTLDKVKFCGWVKKNLRTNPWGPSSPPVSQEHVSCVTGIWEKTKAYEQNKIYWNSQLYPKSWYLISSVNNQVFRLSPEVPVSTLKIHRCNNSYIYVPGAFLSVVIEKCRNSTIFIGAVAKVVRIVDSSNISFTGAGRMFNLCDIYKSTFHLLTPCQPIISGTVNRKVTLAPYNTFYPKLDEDLNTVCLGVNLQKWNKPLEIGPTGILLTKGQIATHSLLRPDKFKNLVYPFEMAQGSTTRNPVELPSAYAKNLQQMQARMDKFRHTVHSSNFDEDQMSQLNAIVTARFQKWLKEQGHLKELKGLRSMQRTLRSGDSVPLLQTNRSVKNELALRKGSENDQGQNRGHNGQNGHSGQNRQNEHTGKNGHNGQNGHIDQNGHDAEPSGSNPMISSRGSGDLSNGGSSSSQPGCSVSSNPRVSHHKSSAASSVSLLNGLSVGEGLGRPGVLSDSEDEVFLYEGDNFVQLDSIFLSDGDDSDVFQDDDEDDEDLDRVIDGYETDGKTLMTMSMDDGLLWKPI